ncbi:MAG: glycosyltransferase [Euryarchaeota archaeon]|nr:glycosyltransferase [Euryarchaeota archaeon]
MLPSDYLPHSVGGRENFTHGLATNLVKRGHDVRVAFHVCYGRPDPGIYEMDGVQVHALASLPDVERADVYACRPKATPGYGELLDSFQPDIVHLHDFGFSASLTHIELAKKRGAKVVMTYHSPGQSCLQRSLLLRGKTPCDGEILEKRCTSCRLESNGAPAPIARLASEVDLSGVARLLPGQAGRLFSAREMTKRFASAWQEMTSSIDLMHVYARWVRDLVLTNGVPESNVFLTSTGNPSDPTVTPDESLWQNGSMERGLRVLYMGRITKVKGVDVLVRAVKSLPRGLGIRVVIAGGGSPDQDAMLDAMRRLAAGDKRIFFAGPMERQALIGITSTADVCVVPSTWLETGPLTVLESWSVGIPVIGSRLGGIEELVSERNGGLLFPPGDHAALARILDTLATDHEALAELRATVPAPPTMAHVATEIERAYQHLLGQEAPRRREITQEAATE